MLSVAEYIALVRWKVTKHWWNGTAGKKEVLCNMPLPWQGCWLPTWPTAQSSYLHVQFIPLQLSNFSLYFKITMTDSPTSGSMAVWDLGRCMGLRTAEEVKMSELMWRQQPSSHCLHCITEIPPGISQLAPMCTCGIHNCIQFIHNEWQTGQGNFDSRTQFTQHPFQIALYFMHIH